MLLTNKIWHKIQDSKKRTILTTPKAGIKISIHKLINKNKFNFTKIVAKDSEINLNSFGNHNRNFQFLSYL